MSNYASLKDLREMAMIFLARLAPEEATWTDAALALADGAIFPEVSHG